MNIFEKLKNYFLGKLEKIETEKIQNDDNDIDYLKPMDLGSNNYKIEIPEIDINRESSFNKNLKTIFIMDDFDGMAELIKDELKQARCCKLEEYFNIIISTGIFAGFSIRNMLKDNPDLIIDIAFLDITLGGIINGEELDGIDIAILLKERNPNCLIKFVTGHTLNKHNPEIFKFIHKFETTFNIKMDEVEETECTTNGNIKIYKHIINKTSNRKELLEITLHKYFDEFIIGGSRLSKKIFENSSCDLENQG
jgi:hypothetical protein